MNYLIGLGRALGLKVNKDTFSEANMKSRDFNLQLKEKLFFVFIRKMMSENKEIFPTPPQNRTSGDIDEIDAKVDYKVPQITAKQESADNTGTQNRAGENLSLYRYFFGKGNNSHMVKNLFKNRFWWTNHEKNEMAGVNFMWTQIKNIAHMETLLCKYPERKSGIHNKKGGTTAVVKQPMSTPNSKKKEKQQQVSGDKGQITNERKIEGPSGEPKPTLDVKLYNKIEDNFHVANKKALLLNMRNYYEAMNQNVFDNLPVTFHIKNGLQDPEFTRFKQCY